MLHRFNNYFNDVIKISSLYQVENVSNKNNNDIKCLMIMTTK